MSESTVVSLVLGTLTVLGGGGGLIAYLRFRKEVPIKQREAEVAEIQTSHAMALASAETFQRSSTYFEEQVKKLREELKGETAQRKCLNDRIEEIEKHTTQQDKALERLRRAFNAMNEAWDELIRDWPRIRMREEPPNKPTYDI